MLEMDRSVNKNSSSFASLRLCALCACILFPTLARAAEPKKITYQDDLLPVLRNSCLYCHNPDKKKAGLDLSTYAATLAGSDNGKVVKPGDPSGSPLLKTLTHEAEPFMPQKADKLPDAQIAMFRTWVATGAPENSGSKVIVAEKKNDMAIVATAVGKPEGPPPM